MVQKIIIGAICCVVGIGLGLGLGIFTTNAKHAHAAEVAAAELKSTVATNELFRNELSEQIDHITGDVHTIQQDIVKAVNIVTGSGDIVVDLETILTELYTINRTAFLELDKVKTNLQQLKQGE